jgi:DNA topoisomerase-1
MRIVWSLLSLGLVGLTLCPSAARGYEYKAPSAKAQAAKFRRVEAFSAKLPALRRDVERKLEQPRADKQTAVGAIVRLMDRAYLRVGSERFAERAKEPSFGASSLRKEHVSVRGDAVRLEFLGKSHVKWERTLRDPKLARAIGVFVRQRGVGKPGARLFEYKDAAGASRSVTERDIRDYVAQFGGKPKDFRTYHANRLLAHELAELPKPADRKDAEKKLDIGIKHVAAELGHTAAIDRRAYQDPARLKAYLDAAR